ncbi:unnamed protein product [Cuscuta epithymum]|uniref:Uncharacterized protein n=1 Tax=Cuscuta epithymum TaxID=186058 RepID=A0AAV0GIY5_9ASTE|nr:unnamed protein product [Cuscuta epithymum]
MSLELIFLVQNGSFMGGCSNFIIHSAFIRPTRALEASYFQSELMLFAFQNAIFNLGNRDLWFMR